MKDYQEQNISLIVAIGTKTFDCGLKFKPVKVYNGLGTRTTS